MADFVGIRSDILIAPFPRAGLSPEATEMVKKGRKAHPRENVR